MKINTFQKENSNKAPKKTICRVQCYLTSKDTLVRKRTLVLRSWPLIPLPAKETRVQKMGDSRAGAWEIQDDSRLFYCARKQKVLKKTMGGMSGHTSQFDGTPTVQIWDYLNTKIIKYSNKL